MPVHVNSVSAYHALNLNPREEAILKAFVEASHPMTDRECMRRMGFADGNAVKPRITALVQAGLLEETGSTVDRDTGKRVRICRPAGRALELRKPDPAKETRKAVCAHVAKQAAQGATKADVARTFPNIKAAELPEIIRALWAFGYISDAGGEMRQGDFVWHITRLGLDKLGIAWPAHWHVDQPAQVAR